MLELASSAAGVRRGGSKRGALLAMLGAVIGGVFGAGIGIPIPVLGSAIGIVLCSALGAMAGAVLGELWKGHHLGKVASIAKAAFWGRLFGTMAKLISGVLILIVGIVAIWQKPG